MKFPSLSKQASKQESKKAVKGTKANEMMMIGAGYRATHVPVGEDQKQHIEFARECANSFNHANGPVLQLPEAIIRMYPLPTYPPPITSSLLLSSRFLSLEEEKPSFSQTQTISNLRNISI